jgi:3-methyladenine DNA glycosylase AlkD
MPIPLQNQNKAIMFPLVFIEMDLAFETDCFRFDRHDNQPIMNAESFLLDLQKRQSDAELQKILRYFKTEAGDYAQNDQFIGVRMGEVFDLAKKYKDMSLEEIEKLLESDIHEARVGAVSIMDFRARDKKTTDSCKKELFDLYIRRHDRINNWDLVDRSAPYVVGGYLADKPRGILYQLANSENIWERRTAIVSCYYFIRKGETEDVFAIAEILLNDPNDIIHKATGSWLRTAGDKSPEKLLQFLDKYAAMMPRVALRYAIEKLGKGQRDHYLKLKK